MDQVTTQATTPNGSQLAYRLLWLAVFFDILAFGIGASWDKRWHATHPFEDFFSPPHLFIYASHLLATLTLLWITFQPSLLHHFGRAFRLWPFPFPVPGAIALAGSGFVITALAGIFDALWHSSFGLDETAWSLPHSMLGWGIFVAFLGVVACSLALAKTYPIGWPSALVFGFLILSSALERIPGPFLNNINLAMLEAVRHVPVLAASPAFQHTIRIYEAANITRLNLLFIPLAAVGAGLGLRLLQRFYPRPLLLLALSAFITYSSPWVPYLVPALVVAVAGSRITRPRWFVLAGLSFGFTAAVVSTFALKAPVFPLISALAAAPAFGLGLWIADKIWVVVSEPTKKRVVLFAALVGLGVPALTGLLDLYLRAHIQ